ncbi:MAG: PAS domain-containing protein [Hyphomicrobium sp.]
MKEATSQQLYAYWNDMRSGRMAPKRFEIEPSQIAAILPDTFILERIDSETARFRLAGTRICDAFASEFRGVNIFELFGFEDRVTLQRQFAVIARQGAVGIFDIEGETETGKVARFEIVVAPLMHTREVVDRYLGSITPVAPPEWLGTETITKRRLLAHDLVWPDGRAHAMTDAMHRQAPFMPHVRNARLVRVDRRQFRVYDGGLAGTDDDR